MTPADMAARVQAAYPPPVYQAFITLEAALRVLAESLALDSEPFVVTPAFEAVAAIHERFCTDLGLFGAGSLHPNNAAPNRAKDAS